MACLFWSRVGAVAGVLLSLARAASQCPETEDLIAAQDGRIQYLSKELAGGGSSC